MQEHNRVCMRGEKYIAYRRPSLCCNPPVAGVLYTEQNHLQGQWRDFRIWNNTQKTKENDVKTILFSLVYLTLIKLPFCMSTGDRGRGGDKERERDLSEKTKKSKSVKN